MSWGGVLGVFWIPAFDTYQEKYNITLVVTYIKGTSEKFKRLCKTKGIRVHFKGTNTLRTQLVNPKDKGPKIQKSGIIYHYKCPHINCPEAYKGESGRALGERVKEHLNAPSPIFHHSTTTGHPLDSDNFNTIHKEVHSHSRTIKEAMCICVNDPTLNRDLGKYQLQHIWRAFCRHHQCYSSSLLINTLVIQGT